MKTLIKLVVILGGIVVVLCIAAIILIPKFVDIQQYKPEIEKKVAEATGRPFTLAGDLNLSVYPFLGVSFSDLHIGNPPGFKEKDFLVVKSFGLSVKLLPLISKQIQVDKFVLDGAHLFLEKRTDGKGNWEGLGGKPAKGPAVGESASGPVEGLPIESLAVDQFLITDALLSFYDHTTKETKTVSGIDVTLTDVSLEKPVGIKFKAMVDGKPVSLDGTVGPLGKDPGTGTLALDFTVKALEILTLEIAGKLVDPVSSQKFDLDIAIKEFSPRKVMTALGETFPVETTDPEALNRLALSFKIKGDPAAITVTEGLMDLDDSKLKFSAGVKAFSKPDLMFDLQLDTIDLDRYLPPQAEEKTAETGKGGKAAVAAENKPMNYIPLRQMVLDGKLGVDRLKAHGAFISNLLMKVTAKNGRFNLDPFSLNLYEGSLVSKVSVDVTGSQPKTGIELDATWIQSGPLLKDLLKKDILEGVMAAKVAVTMTGEGPETIKKTLNGNGELTFKDGAIVGVDLAGMVRNVQTSFGTAGKTGEKPEDKPRTDFAEFIVPFTITNGLVNTPGTKLASPLLRLSAAGDADLPGESLNLRVEPKIVATIKGQGDTEDRSGLTVPVLVTGTFSAPKFRPDLKGMIKTQIPDQKTLNQMIENKEMRKEKLKSLEKEAKSLFKGFSLDK